MAMTEEQKDRQMINRVYGNIAIENPNVTLELCEKVYYARKKALAEGLTEHEAWQRFLSQDKKDTIPTVEAVVGQ